MAEVSILSSISNAMIMQLNDRNLLDLFDAYTKLKSQKMCLLEDFFLYDSLKDAGIPTIYFLYGLSLN